MGKRLLLLGLVCGALGLNGGCRLLCGCCDYGCGDNGWDRPCGSCGPCGPTCGPGGDCSDCGSGPRGGCGLRCGRPCGDSCDPCGGAPVGPLSWLFGLFACDRWCGPSCGEGYCGEFLSDPPDCCDPCNCYGNYTGRSGCGCAGGGAGGYPGGPVQDGYASGASARPGYVRGGTAEGSYVRNGNVNGGSPRNGSANGSNASRGYPSGGNANASYNQGGNGNANYNQGGNARTSYASNGNGAGYTRGRAPADSAPRLISQTDRVVAEGSEGQEASVQAPQQGPQTAQPHKAVRPY